MTVREIKESWSRGEALFYRGHRVAEIDFNLCSLVKFNVRFVNWQAWTFVNPEELIFIEPNKKTNYEKGEDLF